MQQIRGRKVAMILQDPMSSLNPVFSIGMQVREAAGMYHALRGKALSERATALLAAVRIPRPPRGSRAFPHQLSGGMRQRVVGAMAIAAPPRLLIADEPTTSLDLTIQAQYLGLLKDLQQQHRLAMIFVTHNLGIVAKICDRVAVMYAGRIVEIGPVRRIFTAAGPSLYARPHRVDPAPRRPAGTAHRHRGAAARPRRPAAGLLVRPALPGRDGALPRRGAARARPRRRPPGPLLAARAGRVTPP